MADEKIQPERSRYLSYAAYIIGQDFPERLQTVILDRFNQNGIGLMWSDVRCVDEINRWSVFMLQWPCIGFYSLVGRE